MNCPECGHENREGARFCDACGTPLASRCPSCGTELRAGARFCDACGQAVGEVAPPGAAREPRDYTPKHLADKILQSKSALEGERKQLTVLFADVKGSMELADQVDPEEWHRILNRFFQILTDGVHRFEGTVNQYTGDGIMALFGAPIAHEDHAQRTCYAALHLSEEIRRYARELRLERALNFSVRMGVNSGDVVVGKIGDDLRMDYTAQGQTVGLAARMEEIAEPGKVYLAEDTAKIVTGYFELEALGEVRVVGIREPVRVFELQGLGRLRTRFDASRTRGLSKFVGRDAEMNTLEAALERAIQGNGQAVGVVGEAGVGKSRLCFEFAERCRAQDLALYEAHAVAHGKAVPFLAVLELLRSYFGITDQDSDEIARDKIAGRSVRLDENLADALPLLFDFLGVPDPRNPAPQMDPEARQQQLFGIVRRLTHARSEREPAVFLMEDLHWMDGGSEGFVRNLVESLPGARTLVLVNFRPEYHAPWLQKSYYEQLPLVPLGAEAIIELLRHILGSDPSVAGLADLIQERTAGNPFFIEEVVQSLVESGHLEGTSGAYRLIAPVDEVAVPDTVQALLAARIDRLREREKQVLQTASVVGKKFSESVLKEVAELPAMDLADAVRNLITSEFIYEETLYPEAVYAFKHPLTQEVAYDSQLSERRAQLHVAVAQALEALDSAKLDERAALLAHHWEQAGDALEAATWYRRAAIWTGFNNLAESHRHWRKVRALLDGLPESQETIARGAEVRAQLIAFALRFGGSGDEITALFHQAKELATRSGNLRALIQSLHSYGTFKLYSGDVHASIEVLEDAVRRADQNSDRELQVATRAGLAVAYENAGRLSEALARAEEAIELGQHDPDVGAELIGYSPYLFVLGVRGIVYADMGRYPEAERDLDRALGLARQRGELLTALVAQGIYVAVCEATHNAQAARSRAREAVDLAEKIATPVARVFSYGFLGRAHVLNEEWDDALSVLNQGLAIAREHQTGLQFEAGMLASLAGVHRGLGNASGARAVAEEAIGVARRSGTRMYEIRSQMGLAYALLQAADPGLRGEIESALDSAMRLVEETGADGYRPVIHEARAELARFLGDETESGQ